MTNTAGLNFVEPKVNIIPVGKYVCIAAAINPPMIKYRPVSKNSSNTVLQQMPYLMEPFSFLQNLYHEHAHGDVLDGYPLKL